MAADAIASLERIPRSALDEHAAESQARADTAIREGRFDRSLVPVHNPDGTVALDHEEFPRPGTTAESLASLPPSFEAVADYRHTEDAPTYRELVDQKFPDLTSSTCTMQVTRREWSTARQPCCWPAPTTPRRQRSPAPGPCPGHRQHGRRPHADAQRSGPRGAARCWTDAGLTLDDVDLFEVNEAFAVVSEKFMRDLDLDRDKVNVNGGAMALGHPIGATGSILVGTVLDELERRDQQIGLITMCAGGGMAPAIIIERV